MLIGRLVGGIGLTVLGLVILAAGAWSALAIWYRAGDGDLLRDTLAVCVAVVTLAAAGSLATRHRWWATGAFVVMLGAVLGWWLTITPSNDLDWSPEGARTATAVIEGDRLTITNVRDFNWRTETDFDPRWETRTYNLSSVTGADLIMSYWAGETIAHTMLSFGFDNGTFLVFSVEIRKRKGQDYDPIAGFFKSYGLIAVAADERDAVRLRSNIQGSDVRIFRLRMPPDQARALLLQYAAELSELAQSPRFYNTLNANCTTLVFHLVRAIHPSLPLDPRVLLSGYLPDYVYELGALDTSMPFARLRDLSHIHDKALRAGADPDFSAIIRDGVPKPR
jgi:hypothetical protein